MDCIPAFVEVTSGHFAIQSPDRLETAVVATSDKKAHDLKFRHFIALWKGSQFPKDIPESGPKVSKVASIKSLRQFAVDTLSHQGLLFGRFLPAHDSLSQGTLSWSVPWYADPAVPLSQADEDKLLGLDATAEMYRR